MSYQSGARSSSEETGSLLQRRSGVASTTTTSAHHSLKILGALLFVGVLAFASGSLWYRHGGSVAVESHNQGSKTITVQLEGKKKKHHDKTPTETHLKCDDGGYSKRTLKLAYELPFASLFKDTKGQRKYEASSVVVVDEAAYAVCDSSWAISKFSTELQPFQDSNKQIGDVEREKEDSGYEALIHDGGTFYVVRESVQHEDSSYHAIIEELALGDDDYDILDQCSSEFEFEGDSKGKLGVASPW